MDKFVKDPAAVLDYTWDWSDFLAAGETIATAAVTADVEDLVAAPVTKDAETVTAWLTGGAAGDRVLVTCRITTDQGRTDDRSIYVVVSDQ